MGLVAESKTRKRISKDPNNTKWTRDTNTFGQRMLRSQGWEPGQFLGAQNAAHADLHTAANASYIRVVLKDDMKGLGFNKAKEDEITGLDVFSDLLNRLNGKSEEAIEGDKMQRLSMKTHAFVEMKYGPMRFVSGGLLVGDKVTQNETPSESDDDSSSSSDEEESEANNKKALKKDKKKKRKASEMDESSEKPTKTDEKKKRRKQKATDETSASEDASELSKKERKKAKKEKKTTDEEIDSKDNKSKSRTKSKDDESESEDARRARKAAKKARKEQEKREKKEKKELKRKRRQEATDASSSEESETEATNTGVSTPATGTSTPRINRNFSRTKMIAQKRQAVMDAAALNQIFMLKT